MDMFSKTAVNQGACVMASRFASSHRLFNQVCVLVKHLIKASRRRA